jgi:hypothetical protein
MEESNWGEACASSIVEQQKEKEQEMKKKKLCLHSPKFPIHGVT